MRVASVAPVVRAGGQVSLEASSQASSAEACERALLSRLRRFGALTLEEYMAHCLADPRFGYYRRARLGEDFITAPMLSNALGLVVGSWLVACWRRLDCPRDVLLVEAGAGGFELLGDVLSVVSKVAPRMLDGLAVHVVDINEHAREGLARFVSSLVSPLVSSLVSPLVSPLTCAR